MHILVVMLHTLAHVAVGIVLLLLFSNVVAPFLERERRRQRERSTQHNQSW